MSDTCDYCREDLLEVHQLRAVGFTQLEEDGASAPLVKAWCGSCAVPDDIDPEAAAAFLAAVEAQRAGAGR